MSIHFSNISKAEALIALWKATNAIGLGLLHSHEEPTVKEAEDALKTNKDHIDYFFGKPIKTDFAPFPNLQRFNFDQDAGEGAMQRVADGTAKIIGKTKKLSKKQREKIFF